MLRNFLKPENSLSMAAKIGCLAMGAILSNIVGGLDAAISMLIIGITLAMGVGLGKDNSNNMTGRGVDAGAYMFYGIILNGALTVYLGLHIEGSAIAFILAIAAITIFLIQESLPKESALKKK